MTQQAHHSKAGPITVNGVNFQAEVLGAKTPVLVDVSAAWCGPCRLAAPIIDEIAQSGAESLKVVVIDGDESPELVQALRVRGFPTFIVFENGEEVRRTAGFAGRGALRKLAGLIG
jgi:thioredoxin 1